MIIEYTSALKVLKATDSFFQYFWSLSTVPAYVHIFVILKIYPNVQIINQCICDFKIAESLDSVFGYPKIESVALSSFKCRNIFNYHSIVSK